MKPIPEPGPWTTLGVLARFVALDLALKRSGFQRVYDDLVERTSAYPVRAPGPADAEALSACKAAVRAATRYYFRRKEDCLPKAMALYSLLRRCGIAAELCIGVRKYPFGAHAWVEYEGRPLDQPVAEVSQFTVLSRASGR